MKILCFIESYLPGTKGGGPVRGLSNMVAQQSERHEFFILTRNHDYQDSKTYTHVESNQWIKNTGGAKVFYASDLNWKRASIEAIESLKPNWIYLSGAFSPMTRVLLSECKTNKALQNCKILLAPHGNLSPVALQHHFWRKYAWISYAKLRNLYSGISWHAASAREAAQISRSFGADEDIREVPMAPALHDAFESEVTENGEPRASDMDSDFGQAVACFCLVYFGWVLLSRGDLRRFMLVSTDSFPSGMLFALQSLGSGRVLFLDEIVFVFEVVGHPPMSFDVFTA